MPRRIAGTIWAVRLTMTLSDAEETMLKIPNTVCVYHAGGTRSGKGFAEKPHYHIYYDHGQETVKHVVQDLIKSNAVVSRYYKPSNGFWSIDTETNYSLESYWKYVWAGVGTKKQRLVWWDIQTPQLETPQPELPLDLLVLSPGTQVSPLPAPKPNLKSSLEKQKKFLSYCKEYYELHPGKVPSNNRTLKLLYEYCGTNGHTTQNCAYTYVNYAMSHLLQGELRKEHRRQFATRLERIYFSG